MAEQIEKGGLPEQPIGTFKCDSCGDVADGSELRLDHSISYRDGWICVDRHCNQPVRRISDLSLGEYVKLRSAGRVQVVSDQRRKNGQGRKSLR